MSDGPSAPAGWYPDPEAPGQTRFWNGSEWTEHRHQPTAPQAAPPPPPPRQHPPPLAQPQVPGPPQAARHGLPAPNARKPLWRRPGWQIAGGILLVIIIASAASGGGSSKKPHSSNATKSPASAAKTHGTANPRLLASAAARVTREAEANIKAASIQDPHVSRLQVRSNCKQSGSAAATSISLTCKADLYGAPEGEVVQQALGIEEKWDVRGGPNGQIVSAAQHGFANIKIVPYLQTDAQADCQRLFRDQAQNPGETIPPTCAG